MSKLQIKNLSLKYPKNDFYTISNLDFSIDSAQLFVIKGSNGRGKTSLLQALCGAIPNYVKADLKAKIMYNNKEINYSSLPEIAHIFGYMMQDPEKQICFPFLEEELFFGAENLKRNNEAFTHDYKMLIELFPFLKESDKETHSLSFGQKKILILASNILKNPDIFLLDEPGAGLSEDVRKGLIKLILNLKNQGKILLIAEHDNLFDLKADKIIEL